MKIASVVRYEDNSFDCPADGGCSGRAYNVAKEGRFFVHPEHSWLYILVPANFQVPKCDTCGTSWLEGSMKTKVYNYLEESYQDQKELIFAILASYDLAVNGPGFVGC